MSSRASRPRVRLASLVALALLALPLGACGDVAIEPEPTPVVGDGGDLVTEDRTEGPVERISVGAGVTVLMQTGATTSVTVRAESNILPLIHTDTVDGQLIVNVPYPGYVTQQRAVLTVVAPRITSVTMSAGATGSLELVTDQLRVDLSGAAELTGVGRVDDLALFASSDGSVDFAALTAVRTTLDASGGARAVLTVESHLGGTASGGATITLTQRPATLAVDVTSGASVQGAG